MSSSKLLMLISTLILGFTQHIAFSNSFPDIKKEVKLYIDLKDCELDRLSIWTFEGIAFKRLKMGNKNDKGQIVLTLPKSDPHFYFIGSSDKELLPIILGAEKEVFVLSDCENFSDAEIIDSEINTQYRKFISEEKDIKDRASDIIMKIRFSKSEPDKVEQLVKDLKKIDDEKVAFVEKYKKNDFLFNIASANTFLSYQNHGQSFEKEIHYYGASYFANVDFHKQDFEGITTLYNPVAKYVATLVKAGISPEEQRKYISQLVESFPKDAKGRKYALGAIVNTLSKAKSSNFFQFAEQYVTDYKSEDPNIVGKLEAELDKTRAFTIGAKAPEIVLESPEGGEVSLSELEGKVVLIDFWASWCGPCRRENPNVVKMYNRYKDKGFEILGVSLDKTKDKWVNAIEADGLTWFHGSDLKGWSSAPAARYGVRSIPTTVLVDSEGKILARNLRGPQLEQKLAQIFSGD